MTSRKVCSYCSQELGRTSFYRHLNDKSGAICPGRKRSRSCENTTPTGKVRLEDFDSQSLDSSFDVNSGDDSEIWHDAECEAISSTITTSFTPSSNESESVSESDYSSGSAIEIWDESDSEDCEEQVNSFGSLSNQIISAISFFLVFYHLTYRLSERAINTLIGFLRTLFNFLSSMTGHTLLLELARAFPKTLYGARSAYKLNDIIEYTVCPKCNSIYAPSECILSSGESKRCTFIEFPNHPHLTRRRACNEILMKRVKVGHKQKLVPRKVYVYRSVISSLKILARQKDFLAKCDHWRIRNNGDLLGDIYDGNLWKDLYVINGQPFLSSPNNLCLALNIDWFNPYKETQYSAGAVYLVILNLPRYERFREENVILAGMIPGPNEPKQNINAFLTPLVNDFQLLYSGIRFHNVSSLLGYTNLRATLACIACDLPATRKVCGFANFNSTFGCSKCMKQFVTVSFGAKPQYGGYNCDRWNVRDVDMHRQKAFECKQASTKSERQKILHECGVKYSEILLIPHFNIVRCHVIDPMHCLFLGLAKNIIQVWKDKGIVQPNQMKLLQEKVDSIIPPSKVGRIPRKIGTGFGSFTADEWKNWIVIYSLFALHGVIGEAHFKCWCLLVQSCHILLQPVISKRQVEQAHTYLVEYCKSFESLYGPEHCTPNMHMCCHIKDCLLDFGPLSAFWCFPYERYNGLLEGMSKSWVSPEKQMFLKFIGMQKIKQLTTLKTTDDDFLATLYKQVYSSTADYSSFGQTKTSDLIHIQRTQGFSCSVSTLNAMKSHEYLTPPYKEKCFNDAEMSYLTEMYKLLYPTFDKLNISRFYHEYKKCIINGEEYISLHSRSQRSCAIAAKWRGITGIDPYGEAPVRVGQVISFVVHNVILDSDSSSKMHTLARVQWLGDHPCRDHFHPSLLVCSTVPDNESSASFMPVSRIMCRCALSIPLSITFEFGLDHIYVSVPLVCYIE